MISTQGDRTLEFSTAELLLLKGNSKLQKSLAIKIVAEVYVLYYLNHEAYRAGSKKPQRSRKSIFDSALATVLVCNLPKQAPGLSHNPQFLWYGSFVKDVKYHRDKLNEAQGKKRQAPGDKHPQVKIIDAKKKREEKKPEQYRLQL